MRVDPKLFFYLDCQHFLEEDLLEEYFLLHLLNLTYAHHYLNHQQCLVNYQDLNHHRAATSPRT